MRSSMEQTVDLGNDTISSDAASDACSPYDLFGLVQGRLGSLLHVKIVLMMVNCWKSLNNT